MLDYLEGRIDLPAWLRMGVGPTLQSYGIDHSHIQNIYQSDRQVDEVIGKLSRGRILPFYARCRSSSNHPDMSSYTQAFDRSSTLKSKRMRIWS